MHLGQSKFFINIVYIYNLVQLLLILKVFHAEKMCTPILNDTVSTWNLMIDIFLVYKI